jgi:hypothetical protein
MWHWKASIAPMNVGAATQEALALGCDMKSSKRRGCLLAPAHNSRPRVQARPAAVTGCQRLQNAAELRGAEQPSSETK